MKLKEGDVFRIAISDKNCAFGEIVKLSKSNLSVIVFDGLYEMTAIPDFQELLREEILFFANTFDAKFYHKHWTILCNITVNLKDLEFPVYKLGVEDTLVYEDFTQKPIANNSLSVEERDKINYRNFVAPVRVENAIKAYYKLCEWDEDFNKLLYSEMIKCRLV